MHYRYTGCHTVSWYPVKHIQYIIFSVVVVIPFLLLRPRCRFDFFLAVGAKNLQICMHNVYTNASKIFCSK